MSSYFFRSIFGCLLSIAICSALDTVPAAAQSAPPESRNRLQNNSYIGVGAAIGLQGNTTSLGTGGLAILTKVGFSENLSLHDATVLFGSGAATSMIILTADFPIRNDAGETVVSPFLGGGALIRYQDGFYLSPAISGGLDIPLSKDFTGTVRLNVGFPSDRNADLGVLIGAGYNLGG